MSHQENFSVCCQKSISAAYIATRLLDTPFWGLYNLLPIILVKNLGATPYQIGLLITLKPLVSLLSSYWSTRVQAHPSKTIFSISFGRCIAYFPFFFFPFIDSISFFIFSFGFYMLLQVGMAPAWMELLKRHLPTEKRNSIFSSMQVFGHLGGGLMPFLLGWTLDEWPQIWRWLFPVAALLALTAYGWQRALKEEKMQWEKKEKQPHLLLHPWKNAWQLLKKHSDFANFQWAFMLVGVGLMIIQPAMPIFFVNQLHLSFTEVGVAITLCKGIGFASSSSFWTYLMKRINIFYFGMLVAFLAATFPFFLFASQWHLSWLYVAYLLYGSMQSGNELSWNLSGPIFAGQENSSPFSTVNIIAVGLRGLFVPLLGAFLLQQFGLFVVLCASGLLCLLAAFLMASFGQQTAAFKRQALYQNQ